MSKHSDVGIAEELHNNSAEVKAKAKNRIFDVIGVGFVIALGLWSLDIAEFRSVTLDNLLDLVMEFLPLYLGAVLLSLNYYKKGVYKGKETDTYLGAIKDYSERTNNLTGKQLDELNYFCIEYNDNALKTGQERALKRLGITYERYHDVTYDRDGKELKPLMHLTKQELSKLYKKEVVESILKINKISYKGINANVLLGNVDNWDFTDLGYGEHELLKKRTRSYIVNYTLSALMLTFMGVKSILEWGWVGAILIMFKLLFVFCGAYMKYFQGFEDITSRVSNNLLRKIDTFKQFDFWYYKKFPEEAPKETDEDGNITE